VRGQPGSLAKDPWQSTRAVAHPAAPPWAKLGTPLVASISSWLEPRIHEHISIEIKANQFLHACICAACWLDVCEHTMWHDHVLSIDCKILSELYCLRPHTLNMECWALARYWSYCILEHVQTQVETNDTCQSWNRGSNKVSGTELSRYTNFAHPIFSLCWQSG